MKHTHPSIPRTTRLVASVATLLALAALSACSTDPTNDDAATTEQGQTSTPAESATPDAQAATGGPTPITITADGQTFTATLNETEVSQDFIELLPVTLDWYRNSDIEFITELDTPMTETGPFYTDVQPGDLVYYNPMDSLTVIYEETSSVPTFTKMGEITSDLASFRDLPDDVEMRVELS